MKRYRTDNGVYTAREFLKEIWSSNQVIRHSGVGGHHHNGVAENAIKNTVCIARTMMIHASLRWPQHTNKELWSMEMSHAVHLHNHIPRQDTKLSPSEIWGKTKSSHSALKNAHPWGCPVYVLDPKMQDGQKIPKWKPRSRVAQYMGVSPLHASTVGLVRNLLTERISPQFHVVYDDFFETVHCDSDKQPLIWQELVVFNFFKSDFDQEFNLPDLGDEWLDEEELKEKVERDRMELRGRKPAEFQRIEQKPHIHGDIHDMREEIRVPGKKDRETPVSKPGKPRWRSQRNRVEPDRLTYRQLGGETTNAQAIRMSRRLKGDPGEYEYLMSLLMDTDVGTLENIPADVLERGSKFMCGFKSLQFDPDTPTFTEAMKGPHR